MIYESGSYLEIVTLKFVWDQLNNLLGDLNRCYESCLEDENEDGTSKQAAKARIGKGHHSQRRRKTSS